MESLFQFDPNVDYMNLYIIPWAINLVSALAVFVIGRWIAKLVVKALTKILQRAKVDETLIKFLGNVLYVALFVVVIIAALDRLGVNTTSMLAVSTAWPTAPGG